MFKLAFKLLRLVELIFKEYMAHHESVVAKRVLFVPYSSASHSGIMMALDHHSRTSTSTMTCQCLTILGWAVTVDFLTIFFFIILSDIQNKLEKYIGQHHTTWQVADSLASD